MVCRGRRKHDRYAQSPAGPRFLLSLSLAQGVGPMLKVFGFVRRHAQLSHDEYRAAHVGYHNSFGRRLNGIRGYLLNVRANRRLDDLLGEFNAALNQGASTDFDAAVPGCRARRRRRAARSSPARGVLSSLSAADASRHSVHLIGQRRQV